jgi:hypothetical protein
MVRPIVIALTIAAAPTALVAWHNHLKKSAPAADEAVATPKEIRLWFAEKVNPKISSITVASETGPKAETGKVRGTDDPLSIAVDVSKPLAAGKYAVTWRTAGDDGHAVKGTYTFTVK